MTGRKDGRKVLNIHPMTGAFSSEDLAQMQGAIDAVCYEFGIGAQSQGTRDAVARRIMAVYETGRRQPLYLVNAGLDALHP